MSTDGKVWTLDGTVAKYGDGKTAGAYLDDNKIYHREATAGDTAGYKLENNQISYVTDTRKQFVIEGISDTSKVTVDGTTVTVGKDALGTADVKLTPPDGYTLKLADAAQIFATTPAWLERLNLLRRICRHGGFCLQRRDDGFDERHDFDA